MTYSTKQPGVRALPETHLNRIVSKSRGLELPTRFLVQTRLVQDELADRALKRRVVRKSVETRLSVVHTLRGLCVDGKSLLASFSILHAAGFSQLINHGIPNRSTTLPNRSAQKYS